MRRAGLALAAALAFVVGSAPISVVAAPCAGFTDVQDTDTFCNAVQWLKNRQITLGCGAGTYCPSDNVNRAQMALFMNRLGLAISPQFYSFAQANNPPSAIVPGAMVQRYCVQSPSIPAAMYPRIAIARGYMSLEASGSDVLQFSLQYSVDGQLHVDANFVVLTLRNPNGAYPLAWSSNPVQLAPGSTYAFAIAVVNNGNGNLVLGLNDCMLDVTVVNANPTSPPFDE